MFITTLIAVLDPVLRVIAASLRRMVSERRNAARGDDTPSRRPGPKTNA
jgi:hypothetical protein